MSTTVQSSPPLRALAVKSAVWYGATRLWGQGVSWAVTVLLARLLVPEDYGLFAIALGVLAVLELLQEFGLGTAIVQRQDLTAAQVSGVFWMVAGTSLLLTAATFLAAGPISGFYAQSGLAWMLRILCLTFLLNSLGMVPYNLLTKALDLRHRSLAEACGTAASALVALGLAWEGYGVWALVCGHLARAVVLNTALTIFAGWRPRLEPDFTGMRDILSFGLRITGTHLIANFSPALTMFILARFLGGTAVGLFSMAQSLAEAPHRISTAIINQVSLPVFSRLQDDTPLLSTYYLKISKYLAVISLPIQIGLMLLAPDLIPLLLSAKWAATVVPFQIFCLESAVVVLTLTSSPLLVARGRADLLMKLAVMGVSALTLGSAAGTLFGLVGVVTARLIVMVPLRVIMVAVVLRELRTPIKRYLSTFLAPMLSTALMAAAVLLAGQVLAPSHPVVRVIVSIAVGAAIYPGLLLLLDRSLVRECKTMAREVFGRSTT